MRYRFVRGDYSDPKRSKWAALPFGLIPVFLMISIAVLPPDSEYSNLTLREDPNAPSGYRIDGPSSCLLDEKQFVRVSFTAWEEVVSYYMLQRRAWNDEEWYWFIHTVYAVNSDHTRYDGECPDSIWIPSLHRDCDFGS